MVLFQRNKYTFSEKVLQKSIYIKFFKKLKIEKFCKNHYSNTHF